MPSRPSSKRLLAATLLPVAVLLAGCSMFSFGPDRGDDGQVLERSELAARDLVVGDCFDFDSPDGSTVSEVIVIPCNEPHDYIILQQGTLAAGDIKSQGLQSVVSKACEETFEAFKDANTADERPRQQFLLFPLDDSLPDGDHNYSCGATDPTGLGLTVQAGS
ncbi:MAG TPA: hypothetical protein PK781_00150 [Terrimesophilobacter sp.]|nr:hypothetical protein [Terrimesophilobacter sp.]HRP98853.1 hypothetical protein [Terrimesophilobacter sp.]